MRSSIVLALLALLALLAAGPLTAAPAPAPAPAPTSDPYAAGRALVGDIDRIVTPRGIQESFVAMLGGTRQMVSVRGADRHNPILLYIHGGPGSPEMHIAWSFERPWEDYFTVVQWDQRGAGKSFPLNDARAIAPTLTPERYRDDAIELIELLRRRYGKDRIFVLGHSWGSVVGLSVAIKRPDLLYAYLGVGQVVDFRENERVGYEWTLAEARARRDGLAVAELEALRPYPGPGAFSIAKLAAERKWSVRYGALAAGRPDADFYLHAGRLSPLHTMSDLRMIDAGSDFSIATLFPRLSKVSFASVRSIAVPVIFFLGRHDYTAPSPLAESWLARLRAPAKKAIWFENSAHLPMIEEPGRFFAALLHDVRPLADARQSRRWSKRAAHR